jgi:hypothetical protein
MDTQKLVIGQDVYMIAGPYICLGKVVEVMLSGTVVRTEVQSNITRPGELLRFDQNGKQCDNNGRAYDIWANDVGTHEAGPWRLDDIPFAERTALLEQARQDYEKRLGK